MKKTHFLFYLLLACFGIFIILLPKTSIPHSYYPYFLFLFLLITAIGSSLKTYRRNSDSLYNKILAVLILIPPIIYFVVAVMLA